MDEQNLNFTSFGSKILNYSRDQIQDYFFSGIRGPASFPLATPPAIMKP
jgi:hypothetical protein